MHDMSNRDLLEAQQQRVALELAELTFKVDDRYARAIERYVFRTHPFQNTNEHLSDRRQLIEEPARRVLTTIWKETHSQISEHALVAADLSRTFTDGSMTVNALSNLLCESSSMANSPNENDAIKQKIKRIVKAAIRFKLVERTHVRSSYKPIQATELLSVVLMATYMSVTATSELLEEEGEL